MKFIAQHPLKPKSSHIKLIIKYFIDDFVVAFLLFELGNYKICIFCQLCMHFMDSGIENQLRHIFVDLRKNPIFYESVLKNKLKKPSPNTDIHFIYIHLYDLLTCISVLNKNICTGFLYFFSTER